jgi:hypothetical protein
MASLGLMRIFPNQYLFDFISSLNCKNYAGLFQTFNFVKRLQKEKGGRSEGLARTEK